jgi:outer membrane protein assembly factor BamB
MWFLLACGPMSEGPWTLDLADGVAGLVGERVFAWDRGWGDAGGIAEYGARDGQLVRTRALEGHHINGAPSFWEAVPGGYLAAWDAPTFLREEADRLSVGWTGAGSDWFDSHVVVDGSLVIGQSRGSAAVVRLALQDGRELWRAPLVAWSQDITVTVDGGAVDRSAVYATWQEYDPEAPTPTMTIPRRVRAYDLATGAARWTFDFSAEPDGLVVRDGVIVAVQDGALLFIDGATGTVRVRPALRPLNGRLLADEDQVIALDEGEIVAFELATGRERWRTQAPFTGRPTLTRWAESVLVSTIAGKVVALDRRTGALQWSVGLGVEPYRAWASEAALLVSGAGVAGMALPPTAAPESARLHGRVIEGGCGAVATAVVTIDGQRVPVSADGAYTADLVGSGLVVVHVSPDRSGLDEESRIRAVTAVVRLTGRGDYAVPDLPVGECGR